MATASETARNVDRESFPNQGNTLLAGIGKMEPITAGTTDDELFPLTRAIQFSGEARVTLEWQDGTTTANVVCAGGVPLPIRAVRIRSIANTGMGATPLAWACY